jgi:ADP-heptose:LPS heptosyltransferase
VIFSHVLLEGNHTLPKGIQNILLSRLGDIGNVVLTAFSIRALCENFPDSRLVAAISFKNAIIISRHFLK